MITVEAIYELPAEKIDMWNVVAEFAEKCSWRAGKALAQAMEQIESNDAKVAVRNEQQLIFYKYINKSY